MSTLKRLCILMVIACFTLTAAGSAFSQANPENMFLTGKITKVNAKSKQVEVNLLNKGCNGIKTFKVDDMANFKFKEGDKIAFFTDGANCPGLFDSPRMQQPRRSR